MLFFSENKIILNLNQISLSHKLLLIKLKSLSITLILLIYPISYEYYF
jgi:hypothetical protein